MAGVASSRVTANKRNLSGRGITALHNGACRNRPVRSNAMRRAAYHQPASPAHTDAVMTWRTGALVLLLASAWRVIFAPPTLAASPERTHCGEYEAITEAEPGRQTAVRVVRRGRTERTIREGLEATVACEDLTGNGPPVLLIESYTGGVHCCMVLSVWQIQPSLKRLLRYESGALGFDVQRTTPKGPAQLVLGDDFFLQWKGLCQACMPEPMPLLTCLRQGRFVDCTRESPDLIRNRLRQYEVLMAEKGDPEPGYANGIALGYYALRVLLGEDDAAWAVLGVQATPAVVKWVDGHRREIRAWATERVRVLGRRWAG